MVITAAEHDLKHIKSYMTEEFTEAELYMIPCESRIRHEPLGVCAIYSAWNYPIMTALKPLVQAITAGNAVLMKPSEIAPSVSSVVKKLIDTYLDNELIKCIEGGVDVAVELNK